MVYDTRAPRMVATILMLALVLVLVPVTEVQATEVAPETVSDTITNVEDILGDGEDVRVSEPIEAAMPFVGVGIRGEGAPASLKLRTRDVDGVWGEWQVVEALDEDDGPDPDSTEGRRDQEARDAGTWFSDAMWAGPSTHLQVAADGPVDGEVNITVIDSAGLSETFTERIARAFRSLSASPQPAEAATVAGSPQIISRADWGANESWRSGSPTYRNISHTVLHHTVTTNSYTREQAAQQVRNMYHWHTNGMGWSDLGYNFVVDRFGRIYEGRYGGVARGVQGAHARGWNSTSFGVAIMGNYNDAHPSTAAMEATADLMTWKYGVHGMDPDPSARVRINDANIRTLEGHRNLRGAYTEWTSDRSFQFDCPGFNISWRMPDLRQDIARVAAGGSVTPPPPPEEAPPEPEPEIDEAEVFTDPFLDVATTHRFATEIAWMADSGVANGWSDGTFRPRDTVTRQAAVSFLYELAGRPGVVVPADFDDVDTDHRFYTAIAWAAQEGITAGYDDGTFRPGDDVTRQAAVAFIHRSAGEPSPSSGGPTFDDVPVGHRFHTPVSWAAGEGVVRGYDDGTFRPLDEVTRQAMASFLFQLEH